MVPVLSLWLPILLSAVFVFLISSIIHSLLTWHRGDFQRLPQEDAVMDALRPFNLPLAEYMMPYCGSGKELRDPAVQAKLERGPVAFLTVFSRDFNMPVTLAQWFAYCVLVGLFAAYVAGRALGPGAPYLSVFQLAGATAFSGYALALLQNSIWYRRGWRMTSKLMVDGLVYALMTAGTFGWLWPAV